MENHMLLMTGTGTWSLRDADAADALVQKWADENGYRLLKKEILSLVRRGPFMWTTTKEQFVYSIETLDEQGNRRAGWIRCGDPVLGLCAASPEIEVRWAR